MINTHIFKLLLQISLVLLKAADRQRCRQYMMELRRVGGVLWVPTSTLA